MSLTDALKQKVTAVAESAKIADLQRNMGKPDSFLTTDHGTKVAETDNWQVCPHTCTHVIFPH
jgi:catalase